MTGYRRSLALVLALLFLTIAVTGFLLNHLHDFSFINRSYVPLWLLPSSYSERVETISRAQVDIPGGELPGAPLQWVIWDLHTGDFFGPWGVFFYDALTLLALVLIVTGFYMLYVTRSKRLDVKRRK